MSFRHIDDYLSSIENRMEGGGRGGGTPEGPSVALKVQIALILAVAAVGFVGWMVLLGKANYANYAPYDQISSRLLESAAATLGLFATSFGLPPLAEASAIPENQSEMVLVPLSLEIARVIAPLSLVILAISTIISAFFGDSIRLWITRRGFRSKSGLVLCGRGDLVEKTAIKESRRAGRKEGLWGPRRWVNSLYVSARQHIERRCSENGDGSPEYWPIVVVSQYRPERLAELRALGVTWIPADASRRDTLESLGLFRAAALLALDPDVSWNAAVAVRAERVAAKKTYTKTHVVARAGREPLDLVGKKSCDTSSQGPEEPRSVEVTIADFDDLAARSVLDETDPFPGLDRGIAQGQRVLVVATDEPVGESLIFEGIRRWVGQHPLPTNTLLSSDGGSEDLSRWTGDSLRILLVSRNASERVSRILRREPEINRLLGSGPGGGGGKGGRLVIAGYDRPPEDIGDDADWFHFGKGRRAFEVSADEAPTVLIHLPDRHRTLRAARDVGRLPEFETRKGRVLAITDSGPLNRRLEKISDFDVVDTGSLLARVDLFVSGGYEQRLARSLHASWCQRGSRKSFDQEGKSRTPSPAFKGMLRTWNELSTDEEKQWLDLANYFLAGATPFDARLEALEPWERVGLGIALDSKIEDLLDNRDSPSGKGLSWVFDLEIDQHPEIIARAFLVAGIGIRESAWAASLSRAAFCEAAGDRDDATCYLATAFREAEGSTPKASHQASVKLLRAIRQSKRAAEGSAKAGNKQLSKRVKRTHRYLRRNVRVIQGARAGLDL